MERVGRRGRVARRAVLFERGSARYGTERDLASERLLLGVVLCFHVIHKAVEVNTHELAYLWVRCHQGKELVAFDESVFVPIVLAEPISGRGEGT